MPTGAVHENPFRLGEEGRPHQHIQFGTGTFDPVLGLDVGRRFGAWSLSAFGQVQVPLYEGRHGLHAGTRMLAGIAGTRSLATTSVRLVLTAAHELAERWDGTVPEEDGNRGRTDLFLGPGVTIPFGTDYSASIDLGVRVYGQTAGAQLDMPLVLSVSVGRLFHLERGRHVEPLPAGTPHGDVADAVVHGEAAPLMPAPGKWTVFDFWATWCEACGTLDADLRGFALTHDDVAVRRVNIVDLDSPIAQRELHGVTSLPHVRLVDPRGQTAWEASGTPAALMDGIRSRIEGTPPSARTEPQVVQITVTKNGYEPARIVVAKDRPVKLIVTRQTDETCATDIVIGEFGIKRELPLGQPVEILLTPTRSGEFIYECSMNMIKGTISVP